MTYEQRDGAKKLSDYSENGRVKELQDLGIENIDMAFAISEEKDGKGESIDAAIDWVKFKQPEGDGFEDSAEVECKLYRPNKNSNNELVIFTPGYPGGNAGRFERLYAKAIVDAGYTFCTVRHNGTSLTNGESSLDRLGSKKRMDIAAQTGEHYVGGTKEHGYSPFEVVNEPVTPFAALYKMFDRVHFIGHSLGVSANYNTLRRIQGKQDMEEKVGNVVCLSGYVGKGTGGAMWDGLKMPMDILTDAEMEAAKEDDVNICSKQRYLEEMAKIAEANAKMTSPDNVNNVLVFTPQDPIIAGPDRKSPREEKDTYVTEYGPKTKRKLIIRDETGLGKKKQHSMMWISPEVVVSALEAEIETKGPRAGPHYMVVGNEAGSTRFEPTYRPFTMPDDKE